MDKIDVGKFATTMSPLAIGAALGVVVMSYIIWRYLSTLQLDPREPPVLKPSVPFIGHIVGLLRHRIDYLEIVRQKSNRPIATLPMLTGKVYMISSPSLIQAALRNRNLTFDVFGIEFAQRVFGLKDSTIDVFRGDSDIEHSPTHEVMSVIKTAMTGQHLYRMNVAALAYVGSIVNEIKEDKPLAVENVYLWLRDLMTIATAEAIYGHHNPLREDLTLIDALWGFEGNMQPLFLGFLSSVIARPAVANRNRFQDALIKYYRNRYEDGEDVAEITRVRSHVLRKHGLNDADELARAEMGLIFVATTNTIPTLYWFFVNIWLRPELVEALRDETSLLVRRKGDSVKEATVDISQLEENCPLLVSCYREAIRLGNQVMGNRRVLRDTVITDYENDGRSYLLKGGTDVIWSAKALHRAQGTWGEDASEFRPDRFLPKKEGEDDKKMKQHYIPFGGGKHLCPGRNFAFAENLGFMCAMLLGFEVEGLKQENVRMGWARFGEGVAKPPEGFQGGSITIRRREGWEDVKWGFVC